jgi:hypothetical protein
LVGRFERKETLGLLDVMRLVKATLDLLGILHLKKLLPG